MRLVQVALDLPVPRLFDYRLEGAGDPAGRLVKVPFGSSGKPSKIGVVVGEIAHSDQPVERLKTAEPVATLPVLPQEWLELCRFCAQYYHHPLGQVMAFALPPLMRRGKRPREPKPKVGAGKTASPAGYDPTADQQAAIDAIGGATGFATFLLHGVTGSGKTEVYLRAIEAVLAKGGQALMLVPEIALTPQLEGRVRDRFPAARIVAAHSGVSDAARARAFLAALTGEADIVLGTRLAVFMPLPRLGLIVVDEEHDASFKQQEGLRYSARDVAIWRARLRNVPIVLGSATPSLETFYHAMSGRYTLLALPERAFAAAELPTVVTVDTRKQTLQDGLSQELIEALSVRLHRREQSLVFLNRRGYAPVLACPACGWISRCRRCAANLVLHLADRRLRCHHCGLEAPIPRACPDCGNLDIQPFGRGTQRLEERLATLFPDARILRIDRDSADSPKKWQTLLAAIHGGEADILVGTQMLAKGHDFPNLTLVGVVGADAALFAADFRAPERLFAQLMQVGGRCGRHRLPGEVLIQTEYPDHPLYQALIGHDYVSFARQQLDERQAAGFPPFSHQAILRAEAHALDDALAFLKDAVSRAPSLADVTLYDPVPMRLFRLKSRERAQVLIESTSRPRLHAFLDAWLTTLYGFKAPRDLRWHLDVDPAEY
ncbi:primosomal protein N' [Sulfuricystis multivorans]|uniref:primosomal protein N' n=1 Tax=Sulfuricystis multivorans TaxID=2211108 RepID=UPI000F8279FE|nr:primosomal protein N' [Sulfuricystis multivorans]